MKNNNYYANAKAHLKEVESIRRDYEDYMAKPVNVPEGMDEMEYRTINAVGHDVEWADENRTLIVLMTVAGETFVTKWCGSIYKSLRNAVSHPEFACCKGHKCGEECPYCYGELCQADFEGDKVTVINNEFGILLGGYPLNLYGVRPFDGDVHDYVERKERGTIVKFADPVEAAIWLDRYLFPIKGNNYFTSELCGEEHVKKLLGYTPKRAMGKKVFGYYINFTGKKKDDEPKPSFIKRVISTAIASAVGVA